VTENEAYIEAGKKGHAMLPMQLFPAGGYCHCMKDGCEYVLFVQNGQYVGEEITPCEGYESTLGKRWG
jgi:hypothetical protein